MATTIVYLWYFLSLLFVVVVVVATATVASLLAEVENTRCLFNSSDDACRLSIVGDMLRPENRRI
jgi:hypothetical protein